MRGRGRAAGAVRINSGHVDPLGLGSRGLNCGALGRTASTEAENPRNTDKRRPFQKG